MEEEIAGVTMLYIKGGESRSKLIETDLFELLPEETLSEIQNQITHNLGDKLMGYREYLIKVLLPDAVITLASTVMHALE